MDNLQEEQSVQQIAQSYFERDINMNINIEDAYNFIVTKLKLNPQYFEEYILNEYNLFLENNLAYGYQHQFNNQEFQDYLQDRIDSNYYQDKRDLFERLTQLYNDNEHIELYENLDIQQLIYLGW